VQSFKGTFKDRRLISLSISKSDQGLGLLNGFGLGFIISRLPLPKLKDFGTFGLNTMLILLPLLSFLFLIY